LVAYRLERPAIRCSPYYSAPPTCRRGRRRGSGLLSCCYPSLSLYAQKEEQSNGNVRVGITASIMLGIYTLSFCQLTCSGMKASVVCNFAHWILTVMAILTSETPLASAPFPASFPTKHHMSHLRTFAISCPCSILPETHGVPPWMLIGDFRSSLPHEMRLATRQHG
jgi:hypothetical protein